MPPEVRNVAICVSKWSHPTVVLTWAWLRNYFLNQASDRLFIVHTASKDDTWKAGGPLNPDLDTALLSWQHTIVGLSGTLQSTLSQFLERHAIDIVVLPEDFPRQGAVQIGSVADWVKQSVRIPFVLIRPQAVRNQRLRLTSSSDPVSPSRSASLPLPSSGTVSGRKIAIAYPSLSVGAKLLDLAKRQVLLPQDEIFIVHCFTSHSRMLEGGQRALRQTKKVLRSLTKTTLHLPSAPPATSSSATAAGTGGGSGSATPDVRDEHTEAAASPPGELTEEFTASFGAKELEEFPKLRLNVVLKGDPRHALTSFCDSEGIELLIISTRTGGRIRKTLSGGSVSAFLIDKASCPCLVVPYKALGLTSEQEEGEEVLTPTSTSPHASLDLEWPAVGETHAGGVSDNGSGALPGAHSFVTAASAQPSAALDPAAVATLQAKVEERDQIITELRAEVQKLKMQAATVRDEDTHDPAAPHSTY